jgi:hypothetical protein
MPLDARMPKFIDNAYLELDGTFFSNQVIDNERPIATVNFFLHSHFLELRCVFLHAAPQGMKTDVWYCRLDPIALDFSALEWRSLLHPRTPDNPEPSFFAPVTDFLCENHAEIRAFVTRGARAIAKGLQSQILRAWARLDEMVAMRDDAMRMVRHTTPLKVTPSRPLEIECRGFQDAVGIDGEPLDEIVCTGVDNVHLETMSDDHTWIGITLLDGRRLSVQIGGEKLVVTAQIDDDPAELIQQSQSGRAS